MYWSHWFSSPDLWSAFSFLGSSPFPLRLSSCSWRDSPSCWSSAAFSSFRRTFSPFSSSTDLRIRLYKGSLFSSWGWRMYCRCLRWCEALSWLWNHDGHVPFWVWPWSCLWRVLGFAGTISRFPFSTAWSSSWSCRGAPASRFRIHRIVFLL